MAKKRTNPVRRLSATVAVDVLQEDCVRTVRSQAATGTAELGAAVLALLSAADRPLTINELALAVSKQLPERERAAGRTVGYEPVRDSLARLVAAGRAVSALSPPYRAFGPVAGYLDPVGRPPRAGRIALVLTWTCPGCKTIVECEYNDALKVDDGALTWRMSYPGASAVWPKSRGRRPQA